MDQSKSGKNKGPRWEIRRRNHNRKGGKNQPPAGRAEGEGPCWLVGNGEAHSEWTEGLMELRGRASSDEAQKRVASGNE